MPFSFSARIFVVSLVALVGAPDPARGSACPSACTRELRECRAGCAAQPGTARHDCRTRCADVSTCNASGVRARTGAYVVVECRNDAAGFSLHERLVVHRRNCDPVTVMDLPPVGPVADPFQVCRTYGQYRVGWGSVAVGRFQRLGVTPDGRGVIVEVTNDHVLTGLEALSPEPPEEGIFFVSADGRERRRVGPPSARKIIEGSAYQFAAMGSPFFSVSPDARFVAYEDRGPDAEGRDADQIAVIDLKTGERRLVTHLPQGPARTVNPTFVDDRTIFFYNGSAGGRFTVRVDGSGLRGIPDTSIAGGAIVPEFGIAQAGGNAVVARVLGRTPKVDYGGPDAMSVRELFLIDGARALQLTRFDYSDTGGEFRPAVGRGRVIFVASADPVNENPDGVCQVFSVDPLGRHLRQLTHFPKDGRENHGCRQVGPGYACGVSGLAVDQVTGAILFGSSCDQFGRNPNGEQFFSMRTDGTGLRQISSFRGVEPVEGGVQVEMPGPAAYSFVVR